MSRSEKKTAEQVLQALSAADALDAFENLPGSEQGRFLLWIAKASDDEAYRRRTDILVLAMRMVAPALRPGAGVTPPKARSAPVA